MFLERENNSGKLQIISGIFQNNAINDAEQISLSHVINKIVVFSFVLKLDDNLFEGSSLFKKEKGRRSFQIINQEIF